VVESLALDSWLLRLFLSKQAAKDCTQSQAIRLQSPRRSRLGARSTSTAARRRSNRRREVAKARHAALNVRRNLIPVRFESRWGLEPGFLQGALQRDTSAHHDLERWRTKVQIRVIRNWRPLGAGISILPVFAACVTATDLGVSWQGRPLDAASGGRSWWAHLEFTRMTIELAIPKYQTEDHLQCLESGCLLARSQSFAPPRHVLVVSGRPLKVSGRLTSSQGWWAQMVDALVPWRARGEGVA